MADEKKKLTDQQRLLKGDTDAISDEPPAASYVVWMHALAPYRSVNDLHHHIGAKEFDAAAGSHKHRGTDNSVLLFDGETITGDLATPAGLQTAVRAIAAMLAKVGATNSTTN